MQNTIKPHAKKIAILGACLVALVGSGGCLTTMAVMAVGEKVQTATYNAREKRSRAEFKQQYDLLQSKALQNKASGEELLTLAHINHDKRGMEAVGQPSDKATLDRNYLNYLNQAVQAGDLNAKKEWLRLQFLLNSKLEKSDTLLPQLNYQQTMNEYIQQANSNLQDFCDLQMLLLNRGVSYPNTESSDYFIVEKSLIDRLPQPTNSNLTAYSILLASEKYCHGTRNHDTNIPNFRSSRNDEFLKGNLDEDLMNTAVYYGAILEITNDTELAKDFYKDLPEKLKTEIQKKAHILANEYYKNIHVPTK